MTTVGQLKLFLAGKNVFGPDAGRNEAKCSLALLMTLVAFECMVERGPVIYRHPYEWQMIRELPTAILLAVGIGLSLSAVRFTSGLLHFAMGLPLVAWCFLLCLYVVLVVHRLQYLRAAYGLPVWFWQVE